MSVNESHSADAYQVEAPPRRGFRPGSLAGRALLLVFGFFASLAAIVLVVMAAISQMHWQQAPDDIHEKYLPARTQPVPPANRPPTPADVGDIAPSATGAPGGQQQPGYRPSLAPSYSPGAPMESPYGTQQFTPSATPVAPAPRPTPHATTTASPAEHNVPPPPRAAVVPEPAPPVAATAPSYRRVAGKTFKQREDGFLVDTTYQDGSSLPVVELAAGGDEYTRLLDTHRELARFFRLSDRLVLVSGDVVYRIHP